MITSMRQSTLEALGLGTVLGIFERGGPPVTTSELVDRIFGKKTDRGSLVISGANGIVGAGKSMQLGSRLQPFGVPIVALDFPGVPDGIGGHYPGLAKSFGREQANKIMENIIRINYDGKNLPPKIKELRPRFLLEAIPEILDIKRSHYKIFREAFPEIEIRSVTSGFPSRELDVGIAHPAFPHNINKVWEIAEPKPSAITQLLWSLGMVPIPVSDHWSFVLDVLFCGVTLAALRYHHASNMPYWKIDKLVRKLLGPNPLRAHDVIGAKGANFLTWSCLSHLEKQYGNLFKTTEDLNERKDTGQSWYPPNDLRPLVNWSLNEREEEEFRTYILGPLFQMTSLILHENRSDLSHINAIGELCAQFRRGILAEIRSIGSEATLKTVNDYHKVHPEAKGSWHPEVFERINAPEWQQLYVNAEHNGEVGVITIGRESYNSDVDVELNRAIDWLKKEKIERAIVTGDFHLATQMVGADTSDFYPALTNVEDGLRVSTSWSETARRLCNEFRTSIGFVNGKRCLGGFLELLMHCHYLISVERADLGMPEVTLPVVPGMEGCHWSFRKANPDKWPKLVQLLLTGKSVKAGDAVGWLVDYAGPIDKSLQMAWKIATDGGHDLKKRNLEETPLKGLSKEISGIPNTGNPITEAGKQAIFDCIQNSCNSSLTEALAIQAKHSANFMSGLNCQKGKIGSEFKKAMAV